jgi:hypothetical protein
MMKVLATASLLLGTALVTPASAQLPAHTVSGVVYDSVAGAALPGAIVQVVQLDSVSRFTKKTWWGVADARGHFKIAGIPTGRFAFGFQHDALLALGLESPLRIIDVSSDVALDLAIPRGAVVRAQTCAARDSNARDGMLAGHVLDAATAAPLDSVVLEIRWIEVERSAESTQAYRTVPHRVTAAVDLDGKYFACGLAAGSPVNVSVARHGYRDVHGQITIPGGGAMRRDFHLADSRVDRGTASLAGRVVQADSLPVGSGRLLVPALGVDVPITDGHFTLSGLPAGTWVAEARAIGYAPESATLELVAQTTTSATIVLSPKVQPLDAVTIIGRSPMEMQKLAEILERQRVGFGTIFMPGDERLATAETLGDLAAVAAGFRIGQGDTIEGRVIGGSRGLARCHPTLYVDGIRNGSMVPMKDVLAVAMYPDLTGVPVQWRDMRTCGVIAVWTKR